MSVMASTTPRNAASLAFYMQADLAALLDVATGNGVSWSSSRLWGC